MASYSEYLCSKWQVKVTISTRPQLHRFKLYWISPSRGDSFYLSVFTAKEFDKYYSIHKSDIESWTLVGDVSVSIPVPTVV